MDIPKSKIESLGKPYFDSAFISEFLRIIETRVSNPERYFFQIVQRDEKPTMEFGCKDGQMLLDVTASAEVTTTIIDQVSSIASIVWTEGRNSTRLEILSASTVTLAYVTAAEESRKELREYGEYLQMSLFRK